MRELLLAIAGYLPDCWPSERTLGKKLGRPQQSVHRSLCKAREWGLVSTTPRPLEHAWRSGQTYRLVCLSEPLQATIARHHFQTSLRVISKSSSSKKTETALPSGEPHRRAAPGRQEAMMTRRPPDDDWSSPAIGEDPRAPLPVHEVRPVDQAVRLARLFDTKWADLLRRPSGSPSHPGFVPWPSHRVPPQGDAPDVAGRSRARGGVLRRLHHGRGRR